MKGQNCKHVHGPSKISLCLCLSFFLSLPSLSLPPSPSITNTNTYTHEHWVSVEALSYCSPCRRSMVLCIQVSPRITAFSCRAHRDKGFHREICFTPTTVTTPLQPSKWPSAIFCDLADVAMRVIGFVVCCVGLCKGLWWAGAHGCLLLL